VSKSSGEIGRNHLVSLVLMISLMLLKVLNISTAQNLTFPDSLIPLYIAFLAFDEFIATHDKDGLAGAPKVPGETEPEVDGEKVTGIAYKILDDLIREAGVSLEDEEYSTSKTQLREFVEEL
jgi:NEDD8-activating enzyme E1 regulatory subunit